MTQLKSFESIFNENSQSPKKPNSILDLLLSPSVSKEENMQETILIPIDKLKHFHRHPFKMYPPEKLRELAESIEQHGIYQPVLVRPLQEEEGQYEILAGHNRTEAARLAGKEDVPCRVIDCDDDEAILIVTETNLKQREKLLHSEKAKAYEMQMAALRSQGKRTDLTLYQSGTKLDAAKMVAEMGSENRTNVFRYIRLNHLSQTLLQRVDQEVIPFLAGVELSYLKASEQAELEQLLQICPGLIISVDFATELRKESKEMELTEPIMEAILHPPKEEKAHPPKPAYKKALHNVEKSIKQLPEDQLRRIELLDQQTLQELILVAIENYVIHHQ